MRVVDVVNNRTGERETISVEKYEMQRNNFLEDIKDALYVPVNNIYYEMAVEGEEAIPAPVAPVMTSSSGEDNFSEWETLQAKVKESGYAKLLGPEKTRYQELKLLFSS